MTTERFGALLAWPDTGTPGLWRYVPTAPSPQRNEAGQANVTVIEVGGMVILTIGARLGADEDELAAARGAIAAKAGMVEAAVDLRPAEAEVTGASLLLLAGGAETELGKARPSNLPPYSAAFSAMLQGDQAKAVKAALAEGRVVVRYDMALAQRRAVTAELSGAWDGSGTVEAALAHGALRLRTTADPGATAALVKRAVDRVTAEAGLAQRGLAPMGGGCAPPKTRSGTFVEVTETEPAAQSLKLEAGIAGWMK